MLNSVLRPWGRGLFVGLVCGVLALVTLAFVRDTPLAVTPGPFTVFFDSEPPFRTEVHEAVHRKQFERDGVNFWWRYLFRYGDRLEYEAEARAHELCLYYHYAPSISESMVRRWEDSLLDLNSFWRWDDPDTLAEQGAILEHFDEGAICSDGLARLDLSPATLERAKRESPEHFMSWAHAREGYTPGGSTQSRVRARLDLLRMHKEPSSEDLTDDLVADAIGVAAKPVGATSSQGLGAAALPISLPQARRDDPSGSHGVLEATSLARLRRALDSLPTPHLEAGRDEAEYTRTVWRLLTGELDYGGRAFFQIPSVLADRRLPPALAGEIYRRVALFDACFDLLPHAEREPRHRAWRDALRSIFEAPTHTGVRVDGMRRRASHLLRSADLEAAALCGRDASERERVPDLLFAP